MYRYALRQSASVPRFLYPAKGYGDVSLTFYLFQLPDISVVLCNSSVGGEESGLGDDNIYIFGKDSDTVIKHYEKADYVSKDYYKKSPVIKEADD